MDQEHRDRLVAWGRANGLTAKPTKNGMLYSRGRGPTLFSVLTERLDDGLEAQVAFNPTDPEGRTLLDNLSSKLGTATPKGRWQWPRLGVPIFDDALLDRLRTLLASAQAEGRKAPRRSTAPNAERTPRSAATVPTDIRTEASATYGTGYRPDAIPVPVGRARRKPTSMRGLEDLGRERLSKSFFLRDFLYSEIAALNGFDNVPDHPEIAIAAGRGLCEQVLEPLQDRFGRLAIRSAYRSSEVNGYGNANKMNCSSNEHSHGRHIWDHRDARGCLGATACIVVPAFIDYYERTGHWEALAWWIHDHLPYSRMEFYPAFAALNLTWSEQPEGRIASRTPPRLGILTQPGRDNSEGDHSQEYADWLAELERS